MVKLKEAAADNHMTLPVGKRMLQFHPAPLIIVVAGALMVFASMFMPEMSSTQFAQITGNMLIQHDPAILLCSIAATVSAVRYWRVGSKASANVAIISGILFFVAVIYDAQTLIVTGQHYVAGTSLLDPGSFETSSIPADAAGGIWTAGVGCLVVAYGGLMMRYPHLGFGLASGPVAPLSEELMLTKTKICPACAESVKSAARICRYCRHEFDQSSQI